MQLLDEWQLLNYIFTLLPTTFMQIIFTKRYFGDSTILYKCNALASYCEFLTCYKYNLIKLAK